MNYDEYGFPIFDDDFDVSVITQEVVIKKEPSVESIDLTFNLKQEEKKPKEVKHTQPLF